MTLRAIFLTRDLKAIEKKPNAKKEEHKWRGGIYVTPTDSVVNYTIDGKLKGAELIYFEENPNPIIYKTWEEDKTDKSGQYMNNIILENFVEQTSQVIDKGPGIFGMIWDAFSNPIRILQILFFGAIVYAIVSSYL